MGTIGEEHFDVSQCCCGSTDIIVETTKYYFIKRDKNRKVTSEWAGDEEDVVVTCRDCDTKLDGGL